MVESAGAQQPSGSIRGVVRDVDFDMPLAGAQVTNVETGENVATTDQGNYLFPRVAPGRYTLVFAKQGYVRQVRADVVVSEGRLTEVDVGLSGDFSDMGEFVVEDVLAVQAGTEAGLLALRFESPAMLDSISADLMSRAGASDAASALRLVAGATVNPDGKTAVVRGLPDRYVSSQLNGVRLPSADEDKRAVELDQFPSPVLESIRVSKTFTPDQQGDASGGAVDVRLKGIPDETTLSFSGQYKHDTQSTGRSDFLSYDGGGLSFLGRDDGGRDPQLGKLGQSWDGAVGVDEQDSPVLTKWSLSGGGQHLLDSGLVVGGFASLFYERDAELYEDAVQDSYWVESPGDPLTPKYSQGTPFDGDFKTSLFDVDQSTDSVQWGGLGTLGVRGENHGIDLTYLYTHTAEDTATLARDTRGKEYHFPGYDPTDPTGPGNTPSTLDSAPYLRLETLEYTERTTGTLQLDGHHRLPLDDWQIGDLFTVRAPEFEWTVAQSFADLDQPDKRVFGALWLPASLNPGAPPFIPPFTTEPTWYPYKPDANFSLGNLQRIWKTIEEDSTQLAADVKLPFDQWSDEPGYLKLGVFDDRVDRSFDQDSYSNFGDSGASYQGGWEEPWSQAFPGEVHPITESLFDVDYEGEQDISAFYAMLDLPFSPTVKLIGGARWESTEIGIVNDPEPNATWFPAGATAPVALNPGDADVDFSQDDVLPSLALVVELLEELTLRASYSETIARQTFKELTPILQQKFLGGPIFIGNPELGMSAVENYDLRVDYEPYAGGLFAVSWFDKRIDDPIEYVQRVEPFDFTFPVNYPEGELSGWELEVRQSLGHLWESLDGLSVGANATFIDSDVRLPDDEIAAFADPGIQVPITSRDMTNAPEHLYNLYVTYDVEDWGTRFGLFYTVKGDTLVAGAGEADGNFVPSVYAKEYDTLNASVTQKLGRYLELKVQAKNLTNPTIEEVYRSDVTGPDKTRTAYTRGIEYSVTLGLSLSF